MGYPPNVSMVLLVFVISGGVFHYFASQWQLKLSRSMAILLIVTFIVAMIPALGNSISFELRAVLASLFYILIGSIALYRTHNTLAQKVSVIASIVFYILFFMNSWQLLPSSVNSLIFNPIVLLVLISFLILNWNTRLLKIFFITAIAHYLLEFSSEVGFLFL